jgi:hypothetical protein
MTHLSAGTRVLRQGGVDTKRKARQMAIQVKWFKCGKDGHYCDLATLDLSTVTESGVYIIWHEGNPGQVVRIGQGDVSARLSQHRKDPAITAYAKHGTLRVTWATVSTAQRDGVERHLADQWPPLVGDAFPNVAPIAVNSPFAA